MIDFGARFGKPRIQRYKVNDRIRLSVEWRVDGKVSAVEIAPTEYRGYNPLQPLELLSQTADQILEGLIPGITSNGIASETVIRTTYPGFSREVRRLSGASLNRDYPLGDDRTKMIAAGLAVGDSDLSATLETVISALGAPDYQEFEAGKGLTVGVFYRLRDSVRQLVISADEPLLAHSDYASLSGGMRRKHSWRTYFHNLSEPIIPNGVFSAAVLSQ